MIALELESLGSIEAQASAAADLALRGFLARPSRLAEISKKARSCKIVPNRS
ncbi:MAG: hypothetical protein H8E49_07915 [Gammaproteobacteria bacterium]|nr:hypothetical protein [Gammaproteobacteria bacterium]